MAADNFDGKLPPEFDELVGTKNVFFPEELSKPVIGYDFSKCGPAVDFDALLSKYSLSTGLQSTLFGRAIEEVNNMIDAKLCGTLTREDIEKQSAISNSWTPIPCTIFLSYTSNLISAGTREIIRYLAQYKMVDCIVTTAGGIEEDFIKCLAPFAVGDFELPGKELFEMHVNRNGNVLVTDGHYGLFEDWLIPILDQMLLEQKAGETWTPSKLIHRLGKEINHPDSVYYWAYKNDIPVFSPAITDGAIGDMLFFHTFKHDGKSICLDLVEDMRRICTIAWRSSKTGALLLGGGVSKHHTLNANAMRLGLDHAVFINTAQEFDGCDSGAKPDEGVSWGKIKLEVPPVKVFSEVSLVLPLLVSQTFLKRQKDFEKRRDSAIITRVLLDDF